MHELLLLLCCNGLFAIVAVSCMLILLFWKILHIAVYLKQSSKSNGVLLFLMSSFTHRKDQIESFRSTFTLNVE